MTYVESQHVFSQAQAPTVTSGVESYSTNTFDLTTASAAPIAGALQIRYLGFGTPMYVNFRVSTAFTSAGSTATVVFSIGTDAVTTLASGYTSHLKTAAIIVTTLVFGYTFSMAIPADSVLPERYLGTAYLIGGENLTAGAVTAWMDNHPVEKSIIYKSGQNFA